LFYNFLTAQNFGVGISNAPCSPATMPLIVACKL